MRVGAWRVRGYSGARRPTSASAPTPTARRSLTRTLTLTLSLALTLTLTITLTLTLTLTLTPNANPNPHPNQGCDFCAAAQGPHAWYKSSQWVTLWAEHARQLLATDATPPEWKATLPLGLGMGAPDELQP